MRGKLLVFGGNKAHNIVDEFHASVVTLKRAVCDKRVIVQEKVAL